MNMLPQHTDALPRFAMSSASSRAEADRARLCDLPGEVPHRGEAVHRCVSRRHALCDQGQSRLACARPGLCARASGISTRHRSPRSNWCTTAIPKRSAISWRRFARQVLRRSPYEKHNVRDFVVDCDYELDKLLAETNGAKDLRIFVRIATPLGRRRARTLQQVRHDAG